MIDVLCMEAWRSTDEGDDGDGTSKEHTSTTIDASNEDKSTAAEAQQLLIDHQQWEHGAQEARQEEASQQDDGLENSGTDTDLPPLVRRQREEASSDDSTSDGSYDYHTDNDNSSIEGSDDDSSNTVDCSSDEDSVQCQDHDSDHTPADTHVPQSIDTRLITPPWMYARVNEDDYDLDQDDDDLLTPARRTTPTLRMRGGGPSVVEGIEELEQPQPQPTHHPQIPTTIKKNNHHKNQNMTQ